MKIVDILTEDLIIPQLVAGNRDGALEELVDCIVASTPNIDRGQAIRVLLDRERIGSTGVGQGLAIPHARLGSLKSAVACFARSRAGVDFGAIDGKPTHLFLTLLAPDGNAGVHLKALARASRLLKDATFRAQLMEATDRAQIWDAIVKKDLTLTQESGL